MKIEVGGVYRARNGKRVEITGSKGGEPYPYEDHIGECYTKDGRFYTGDEPDKRDLIAPWSALKDTYITILEAIAGPDVCAMARKIEEALSK